MLTMAQLTFRIQGYQGSVAAWIWGGTLSSQIKYFYDFKCQAKFRDSSQSNLRLSKMGLAIPRMLTSEKPLVVTVPPLG